MPSLGDDERSDLESLEVSAAGDGENSAAKSRATMSKTRRSCASSTRCCWMRSRRGASDVHFEPYEKMFACGCAWTAY